MSFIQDYLDYAKNFESPTSFWKWSAYAAVAAVMRDNCYLQMGRDHLYSNIYVLLLADSAVQRKDNPVRVASRLVQSINNTKVINGRSSIQGILDELAKGETDKKTGVLKRGGSALWIAPELSAGIVSDPEAVKILTDIYTFQEKYDSRLRTQANFTIKNLCFSFLAASNEELLRDVYDIKATMGGLLGRTFLVTPNEFRKGNSLFGLSPEIMDIIFEKLKERLMEISMMNGAFRISAEAIEVYEEWYIPFRAGYEKKPDKSGIAGRIHTSIIKLAMILAASDGELKIEDHHMKQSIVECMDLIPNYTKFLMASGKSSLSEIATVVLSALFEAKDRTLSRKVILQRFWNMFDQGAETLDKLITTLEQGGMIIGMLESNEMSYKMTQKCVDILFSKEEKK